MDASSAQSVNILETFNEYQYKIYKLDFCSYNFHIHRFSRFDKGEVDVYRFMSKHSSDHYVLFCHDPFFTPRHRCFIMHEVDAYKDRFEVDTTLRNKGYCKSWNAQRDKSLLKICYYQHNVPQHYYLLDTLVLTIAAKKRAISFPEPMCLVGAHQKTRGLWERDQEGRRSKGKAYL